MALTRYWQWGLVLLLASTTGCSGEASMALRSESQTLSHVETVPGGGEYGAGEYGGSDYGGGSADFGRVYLDTDGMSNAIDDAWPYTPGCVYEYVMAGCSDDNLVVRHDYCDDTGKLHEAYVTQLVLMKAENPDVPAPAKWLFCGANQCCERHDESVVDCDRICRLQDFTGGGCITIEGSCGHGYCSCVI